MLTLAIIAQYAGILIALAGMMYIYPKKPSKQKYFLNIILGAIIINEIGYLFELQATNISAAITAIKIAYVGKMVAEYCILMFVLCYAEMKMPRWLQVILVSIHAFILYLVWNCETNGLYYKTIDYTMRGLYPHVVLTYGFVYNIFTVLTFSYMFFILFICITRFIQKKDHKERMRMVCLTTPPITFVIGLYIYRLGITNGYDTTALSYLICAIVFIITMVRYDLIDEKEVVETTLLEEFSEAVLVLNENDGIEYANKQFVQLYGDYKTNPDVKDSIIYHSKNKLDLKKDNSYFHVISKELSQSGTVFGSLYVLHDVTQAHMRMELINNYNRDLEHDVDVKTKSIQKMQNKLILGMANMVENRDTNTGGHIKRTSKVVKILIDEMCDDDALGLSQSFCENMIKAAPMHDLGKIAVDDAILRKTGKFTEEEYEIMKTHSVKGAIIVRQILEGSEDESFTRIAENVAHYHHERVDGTGYPDHLKGDEIPFEARIMAIADVYDALVSKRCYKDSMPFDKAFDIIMEGMGTQFDKRLEPYFVSCRESLEEYYTSLADN